MDQNIKDKTQEESLRWHCIQHKDTQYCQDECYFQTALTLFGKKHTLSIIRLLLIHDKLRFNETLKELSASPKTLTERLKDLKKHGLIDRKVFNEIPIRVEYSLTKHGRSLEDIFERISIWSKNVMMESRAQK